MSSKFLKDMKTRLDDYGYTHHWKLNKEKSLTDDAPEYDATSDLNEILLANSKIPQCQNADIIIPDKKRTADRVYQLRQFMAILGTPIKPAPTIDGSSSQAPLEKPAHATSVTHDDDLRQFRIQEFIDTERSYLESLQAALQCVVQPLSNDPNYKHILNTYKCTKIFLNLPRLHEVTELFLRDLESRPGQFGQVCYDHMSEFKCYRKYLMEQHDAQQLHAKELRANSLYKRFIDDARQHPLFKMRKFKDVLMEPVQRVGRYAMMLKDILQLTPSGHPDYAGLTAACQLIRDIATMADDAPTKAATMFMNIYNAVKECPCSLVNPNRSLVAFLDAYEIQRDTNTPARSVTLFLFTDKIMVAARPSHQRTEEALQAWQDLMPSGVTSNGTGTPTGGSKREPTMKFKGWIGIDAIELFGGNTQDTTADTFLLHAAPPLSSSLTERRASITTASYEKYFRKGPRLFSVAPGSSKSTSVTQFRVAVEKVKALSRKYSDKDMAYERKWHSMNVYSNVYTMDDYLAAETRNNIAILYMESTSDIDLERLFPTSGNAPWIVALIQADLRGFRFHVCSRIPLAAAEPAAPAPATSLSSSTHESTTIDFERVFWNNVLLCERKLRHAPMFSNQHDKVLRSEVQKKSRSRSVPRPSSLTSISKIFNHGINLPLSPVSPKSTSMFQGIPVSSKSTPMQRAKPEPLSFSESGLSLHASSSIASGSRISTSSSTSTTSSSSSKHQHHNILRRFASKSSNALSSAHKLHDAAASLRSNLHPSPPMHPWHSAMDVSTPCSFSQSPSACTTATTATTATGTTSFSSKSKRDTRYRSSSFTTATTTFYDFLDHPVPPRPNTCSALDVKNKPSVESVRDLSVGERRKSQSSHRGSDTISSINSTRSSSLTSLTSVEDRFEDAQYYASQERVMETAAMMVQQIGGKAHERWRALSQRQATREPQSEEAWQALYAGMMSDTMTMLTELTNDMDQVASMLQHGKKF